MDFLCRLGLDAGDVVAIVATLIGLGALKANRDMAGSNKSMAESNKAMAKSNEQTVILAREALEHERAVQRESRSASFACGFGTTGQAPERVEFALVFDNEGPYPARDVKPSLEYRGQPYRRSRDEALRRVVEVGGQFSVWVLLEGAELASKDGALLVCRLRYRDGNGWRRTAWRVRIFGFGVDAAGRLGEIGDPIEEEPDGRV